jgi:hypothetical protein
MSIMFYRFSPDDVRIRTPTAIRDRNVIRIPKMSEAAIYGPYVDLPAGRYDAVIHFDPGTPCSGSAIMDVFAGTGAEQLAQQRITVDQIIAGGMTAKLEFSCPVP